MKNFQSFTDDDPEEKPTRVLIDSIDMMCEGDLILIRIRGSHFLWKLVRRIVGILVEVGRGRLSANEVENFIREKSDAPAHFTAPPSGLFLEKVWYKKEVNDLPLHPAFPVATAVHPHKPKR
jgi:tRNA pseudouridine38-40 synthase